MEISDVHKNSKLLIDGTLYNVDNAEFVKPGKGRAIYRLKLRNLLGEGTLDRVYHSGDKVEEAPITTSEMQYLYKEGDHYHFMDNQNYEQIIISGESLGEAKNFLIENLDVKVLLFRDKPIGVELPNFVNLRVIKTELWVKGDTSKADYKRATVETGYELRIPPFVGEGELITIDTRSGEYSTRVKE